MRRLIPLAAVLVTLAAAPSASAAIPSVFNGDVTCAVQSDGVRFCGNTSPRSTTKAFDGVPIDVNVAFPPQPASGPDGNFPLIMVFHGYGGSKINLNGMRRFLNRGYAVFTMTDRGFHESCGSSASRSADPAGCQNGFVRLIDARYEVRDAQEFAADLADDNLIDPQRIGATGGSYGGGMSLALAALRDRKMLQDSSLVPWVSPGGKNLRIAAAAPFITWSDLAYSLTPNGGTLDYLADSPYEGRFGVMKQSLVNGLYVSGLGAPGYYAAPGTAPDADITGWRNRLLQGEPYDGDATATAILDEITSHHSPYYIDHSQPPAPLLLANGWSDDLFPVDEMVRFYNRTRSEFPDAPISLFAAEISGHPRSLTKPDALARLGQRQNQWLDFYVKGSSPEGEPFLGVEAMTKTCPASAASGVPAGEIAYRAPNWAKLSKGEVRIGSDATGTIAADGGGTAIAGPFDPVTGGGACVTTSATDEAGTVNRRTKAAPAGGFTLLGSPTVIADFTLPGNTSQVAARLLDVGPDGQQSLVTRGLWRPRSGGPERQVFQLHPVGWHFAEGHQAKLQLLARDAGTGPLGGYGRPSDDQQAVTVSDLNLRLPVAEVPGALDGFVKAPSRKRLPDGAELAADFEGFGKAAAHLLKGNLPLDDGKVRVRIQCPKAWEACHKGTVRVKGAPKKGKGGRFLIAEGKFNLDGGEKKTLRLPIASDQIIFYEGADRFRARIDVDTAESANGRTVYRSVRFAGTPG